MRRAALAGTVGRYRCSGPDMAALDCRGASGAGERWDDMTWRGMTVTKDRFGHRAGPVDTISGRFFGPDQEEVGGVFERAGTAVAFGGGRKHR